VLVLYLLKSQPVHADSAVWPVSPLYFPAEQTPSHCDSAVWPVSPLYFPAGQTPSHCDSAVWPVSPLYFPAGQFVHAAADLLAALYLPAVHAATLAPDPVKPATAKHALRRVLPVDVVAVWLGHAVQAEPPVLTLYCPEGH